MQKLLFVIALSVTAFFQNSYAQNYNYGYYQQQQAYPYQQNQYQPRQQNTPAQETPEQIVRMGISLLKNFTANKGSSNVDVNTFLNQRIAPYFDFDYMAKWSAGRGYHQMNEQQKEQFSAKLKSLFFGALARNLGTYSSIAPRIDIYPAQGSNNSKEITVSARVTPASGYALKLDFRFYKGLQGWKIFDVTANGTSAVVYYRKVFNNMRSQGFR